MEEYEALGGEVAESEVGEDDFGCVVEYDADLFITCSSNFEVFSPLNRATTYIRCFFPPSALS